MSVQHNSIVTLIKSGAPYLRIDMIYMIYLDMDYFSIVCFSIYYSCFLYIQHVVARNKFTSFRPWKTETLTLLTVKENLYTNLLRTIISSLVNKNYYYIVTLFLRYAFLFCLSGFCISLSALKYPWIRSILCRWKREILCQRKSNTLSSWFFFVFYVGRTYILRSLLFIKVISQWI